MQNQNQLPSPPYQETIHITPLSNQNDNSYCLHCQRRSADKMVNKVCLRCCHNPYPRYSQFENRM